MHHQPITVYRKSDSSPDLQIELLKDRRWNYKHY
jgi:hypothetical protein